MNLFVQLNVYEMVEDYIVVNIDIKDRSWKSLIEHLVKK